MAVVSEITTSPNLESFGGIGCTLGIDEAGRGPVLGPMVYAIAVCHSSQLDQLKTLQVADSKMLTEERREDIYSKANEAEHSKYFAYALRSLSPEYISTSMLKRIKYNLNEISHESAMTLIELCVKIGINIDAVYVDTVGPPESYQAKLRSKFPSLKIVVSKKADSLFPIVSAASICAKVNRDRAVKNWQFKEGTIVKTPVDGFGSGYPADPGTKEFLKMNIDPVFGFPTLVRFSWSTAEEIILKQCVKVHWEDDNIKPEAVGTKCILNFFTKLKRKSADSSCDVEEKKPKSEFNRSKFFDELNLRVVEKL